MFGRIFRSRVTVGVVSAGLAASVVGGFALAAIPQSVTTQITTCYPKTGATKVLRVIDYQSGQRCTASENTLSWQANGMHWRGAWSSATAYAKHDVVASGGSSYVAVVGGVNHAPPNSTYWAVLAAQGPAGPAGPQGAMGPSGPPLSPPTLITVARSGIHETLTPGNIMWIAGGNVANCLDLVVHLETSTSTNLVANFYSRSPTTGTPSWHMGTVPAVSDGAN